MQLNSILLFKCLVIHESMTCSTFKISPFFPSFSRHLLTNYYIQQLKINIWIEDKFLLINLQYCFAVFKK